MRRWQRLLGSLPPPAPRNLLPAEAQPRLCAAPPAPCAADGVGAAPPRASCPRAGPGRAGPSRAKAGRAAPASLRRLRVEKMTAGAARLLRGPELSATATTQPQPRAVPLAEKFPEPSARAWLLVVKEKGPPFPRTAAGARCDGAALLLPPVQQHPLFFPNPPKKAGRKWLAVSGPALVLFNIFIKPCAEPVAICRRHAIYLND